MTKKVGRRKLPRLQFRTSPEGKYFAFFDGKEIARGWEKDKVRAFAKGVVKKKLERVM